MNYKVTTTIKAIIVTSSEPVRKDTIRYIFLLQNIRMIISSIIALITYEELDFYHTSMVYRGY